GQLIRPRRRHQEVSPTLRTNAAEGPRSALRVPHRRSLRLRALHLLAGVALRRSSAGRRPWTRLPAHLRDLDALLVVVVLHAPLSPGAAAADVAGGCCGPVPRCPPRG